MHNIIGRTYEQEVLTKLLESDTPELLAVYGRRRVGKTFLITEFFKNKALFLELTGSKGVSQEMLLARFAIELTTKFRLYPVDGYSINNWEEGFAEFKKAVDKTFEKLPDQKIVLFIDEIPWIAKSCKPFLSSFEFYWNRYFSKPEYAGLLCIICGSAASRVIDNIINSKGGMHNRVTKTIQLMPFTLGETREYLQSRRIKLDNKQITELYMALGGVPLYLSFVPRGLSASQIINQLCFGEDVFLQEEFKRIFSSLFDSYRNHEKIIRTLAQVKKGLNRNDLLKMAKIPNGGDASVYLNELQSAGFIIKYPSFGKKSKGALFRLTDEYSIFYLNWIEPVLAKLPGRSISNSWQQISLSPQYKSWSGFAFEGICLKHAVKIKECLGIAGVLTYVSSWSFRPNKGEDEKGVQIDLIFERADRLIHLFEIKFVNGEHTINKKDKEILEHKKAVFIRESKIRYPVFITMITPYGTKENEHYINTVESQITIDELFR